MSCDLIPVPGFLFQALSVFSFLCWALPDNVPVNQLFGVYSGLGMSVLTFDWTQISWIGSPLMGMRPDAFFFLSLNLIQFHGGLKSMLWSDSSSFTGF